MTDEVRSYAWRKRARVRTRVLVNPLVLTLMLLVPAVVLLCLGSTWGGLAVLCLALSSYPAALVVAPRVDEMDGMVRPVPRPAFVNSFVVFPCAFSVATVLLVIQAATESDGAYVLRWRILAAVALLGTLFIWRNRSKKRGGLLIGPNSLSVDGVETDWESVELEILEPNRFAFPHLFVSGATLPRTAVFPTMAYGLEANSTYSALRHLAETDAETRRSYSPELIREMLVFTPDRQVAVGEDITVRVVARPESLAP